MRTQKISSIYHRRVRACIQCNTYNRSMSKGRKRNAYVKSRSSHPFSLLFLSFLNILFLFLSRYTFHPFSTVILPFLFFSSISFHPFSTSILPFVHSPSASHWILGCFFQQLHRLFDISGRICLVCDAQERLHQYTCI